MSKNRKQKAMATLLIRFVHRCVWCGTVVQPDLPQGHPRLATREHLLPDSRGGSQGLANLALACWPCNQARGDGAGPPPTARPDVAATLSDGHRWAWSTIRGAGASAPQVARERVEVMVKMRRRAQWLTARSQRTGNRG